MTSYIQNLTDFINKNTCASAAKNIFSSMAGCNTMDPYHRVHFFERAALCQLCAPETYIGVIAETYPEVILEIAKYIEDEDYRSVIDKYIIPTYKDNPSKKNQYEYFRDLKDESTMRYLAVGVLCERAAITIRNTGFVGPNIQRRIERILNTYGVTQMLDFTDHCGSLWSKSPTYFINSIFYAMYVTRAFTGNDGAGGENHNKLQNILHLFTDTYIQKTLYDAPDLIYTYMYGVTHIVIQLSDFYRHRVYDHPELIKALKTFISNRPIDFNTYIDLYNECNLCLRLLGENADPWVTEMNLQSPVISPFVHPETLPTPDLKHEHTYSLFLMEYLMMVG